MRVQEKVESLAITATTSYRGEGPARSTLSLILDPSDVALRAPVHRRRSLKVERRQEGGPVQMGSCTRGGHLEAVVLSVLLAGL